MMRTMCIAGVFCFLAAGLLSAQDLTKEKNTLFSGSGNCAVCHVTGNDVLVTPSGEDVSPVSGWRSTMMGNAARDPYWRAKVSAEIDAQPALQSAIEDKCATCHTPMTRTDAIHGGATSYSIANINNEPLAMDGVSCTVCHQIRADSLGTAASYSGGYIITDAKEIFGPYENPEELVMNVSSGYKPVKGAHIEESEFCAACHTLFTPYTDNTGSIAGTFPEQMAYFEWKNSVYPAQDTQCQTCHMPAVADSMVISALPSTGNPLRSPVFRHNFVGANTIMPAILKTNGAALGVTAGDAHFDSTLNRARVMLQDQSITLAAAATQTSDTLDIDVTVTNLTGHKFPTGFPSRRAWLHVKVLDGNGVLLFESGRVDTNYEIIGLDAGYEPHHAVISDSQQVQVYEAVPADVDSQVTYTLLKGAFYIKDNRIPPSGFVTTHAEYTDMAILGEAALDDDFNIDVGVEGTGSDVVQYRVPVPLVDAQVAIQVDMYYQSIAPRFADDLFTHSTPEVAQFQTMYNAADKTPELAASLTVQTTITSLVQIAETAVVEDYRLHQNYPNPFNPATTIAYSLSVESMVQLTVYNMLGQEVCRVLSEVQSPGSHQIVWNGTNNDGMPVQSGIYFYRLTAGHNFTQTRKMLLLK
jgi:hypothetical protein